MTNHFRKPFTSPRSAAKTPSWQVTDESTKIVVLKEANGMFRSSTSFAHNSGLTDLKVKYIANKAAKNISSLASQTMVPIDTMLGRSAWLGTLTAVAVLTP
jgi:hypothetical protein